jgi:CHAT domain-containing protein/tetratricopeptide (TPR) repeat protein
MNPFRILSLFVLLICLTVWCVAQPATSAPTPQSAAMPLAKDEAELRAVVEQYFAAYAKEDLDGVMRLWSEKSPDYAERKKTLADLFAKDDYSVSNLTITRVKMQMKNATLRASLTLKALNKNGQERSEVIYRNITLMKEDAGWTVWRYVPATTDLVEEMLATPDLSARQAILNREPELTTPELVRTAIDLAMQAYRKADLEQSLKLHQLGLQVAERLDNKPLIAQSLNNVATVFAIRQDFAQALELYGKALPLAEAVNDKALQARTLYNLGSIYTRKRDYTSALNYLNKALSLYELLGERGGIAVVLNDLGINYAERGDYLQALTAYSKALPLAEAAGDKPRVISLLSNNGLALLYQGNFEEALQTFNKALSLQQSMGNSNLNITANLLANISQVHYGRGDYAKAFEALNQALPLFETAGDKASFSRALSNLGDIHSAQGNYAQAQEFYDKALALFEASNDKLGVGRLLGNVSLLQRQQGNYTQALQSLDRSLHILEANEDKSGIATALYNIGVTHLAQGAYAKAVGFYEQALRRFEVIGSQVGIVSALAATGHSLFLQGKYAEALDYATRSIKLARQIGATVHLSKALKTQGDAYFKLSQPGLAVESYLASINEIEQLRALTAGGEQDQQRYFESNVEPYYAMAELLIQQGNLIESLAYLDRAKARVMVDVLRSGRVNIINAMSPQEQEQEAKFRTQLLSLNSQILKERQREKRDQQRLLELEAERTKAQLALENFQTSLYAAHPELKVRRGEADAIKLEDAAALLPNDRTVLLEFAVGNEKVLLFAITKSNAAALNLQTFSVPIKRKDLAERISNFQAMMQKQDITFKSESKALFDLLLKPARALLQGKTSIVIVPDGPLWELPFQTLVNAEGRYLIEDTAISYAPSLTYLRERYKQSAKPAAKTRGLLALGINEFGAQTIAQERQRLMGGNDRLTDLKSPEPMVKAIGSLYPPQQSKVLLGREATEERFKAEAGNYRVLHLATHGLLNDRSPMYSQIVLAPPGEGAKEDGFLEAWELMNLDLNADLAILSACETGRGRIGNGEGVIGLMWALFVAGVPATVVSQWQVDDKATEELMVEFHRQLQSPKRQSKAEALRQAALKLLKQERYRHPFNWAGFVLVGDGR